MIKVEKFDCLKQGKKCRCNSTLCNLNMLKIKFANMQVFTENILQLATD